MSEQQVPAKASFSLEELSIGELTWKALIPTQQGWIVLGHKKKVCFDELTRMELEIQGIIAGVTEEKDLAKVQEKLNLAKTKTAELKDCRLQFTGMLNDRLIIPAMEFEKRAAASLDPVVAHELALRLDANKKANEAAALQREISNFQAHIKNEFYRIATEYRNMLEQQIQTTYVGALQTKMPVDHIPQYIKDIQFILPTLKTPPFVKFVRTLITDEKAKEIFAAIEPYKPQQVLDAAIKRVEEVYSMYKHDYENAEAAAKAAEDALAKKISDSNEALALETSTNKLLAQATPAEPLVLTGGKTTVKSKLVIVTENTEAWAIAVIANTVKNWNRVKTTFKVKTWEKLSLGQMADALGKIATENQGEKFEGLTLKEENK